MGINSLPPFLQSEENKQKIKTIGAPAILAAGATFVASRAPKNLPEAVKETAKDSFKFSKRVSKTAKAGILTAAVMAVLSLKKEDVTSAVDKVKGLFNKGSKEEQAVETVQNADAIQSDEIAQGAEIEQEEIQNAATPTPADVQTASAMSAGFPPFNNTQQI